MRPISLLLAVLLASCGDGDGGSDAPSGQVAGRPFTAREIRAVRAGTGDSPCTLPFPGGGGTVAFGVTGLKIDLASFADVCGDYASAQCTLHAGSQSVTIIFAKLDPAGGAPPLAAGTYPVFSSPATAVPDGAGLLTVTYAQALGTGAAPACSGLPSPAVQGGTLRLDDPSGDTVRGAVDLTFQDGSTLSGSFAAPICPGVNPNICQLATTQSFCTLPPTCAP